MAARTLMMALGVAGSLICTAHQVHAQTAVQSPTPAGEARRVTDLSAGWRFRFGGDAAGAVAATIDDSAWQRVDVPHTWNRVGTYAAARAADSDMRQGAGWYRRTLTVPKAEAGRRLFLEFDAVSVVADVWINGEHVGGHQGAFARFRLDATQYLRPGVQNVIVVRADNSAPAPGTATENVIPLGGDFFLQGGIYRGVRLISVADAHIDLSDHGGPGVYVHTANVTGNSATLGVRTLLANAGKRSRALTLVTSILDADGEVVARDSASLKLASGSTPVERTLHVMAPRLWQGRADPYLYSVETELRDSSRLIDRQVQSLGIRTFSFDAERGFILNGKVTPLHGVSRHQDVQGRGWALTPEDHASDMAILEEVGANAVRHAHYQHAQEWVTEADRSGMAVWAELPFVHQSSLGGGAASAALIANAREQLTELVRQNYNHPSIMLWSVGNEVDLGAGIDAARAGKEGPAAQSRDMLVNLDALARQEDPTRPTVYADCCEETPSPLALKGAQILNDVTQVTAINRYFGWYYGQPDALGPALDRMHAKYPGKPIALSEYGAGGALTQHSDNVLGGPVSAYGRPQPEEYQSWVLEENWKAIRSRPYLAGSWLWNMFDFATTSRNEGDATDINTKGLITYDRKVRKDAFYFFKANWSQEPVLHLNGRRYADRAYATVDVRAYSSAGRVSLSLNGKPVGEVACPDRVCVWQAVALAPGANRLLASAVIGGKQVTDEVDLTAPDPTKGVFIDAGALVGQTAAGDRYGSDNFFRGGAGKVLTGRNPFAPPPPIEGTDAQALFASYREGGFAYDIPLPDGRWTVTIATFEPDAAKGPQRSFAVLADGKRVLDAFSPMQAAGAARKAVTRSLDVQTRGGKLVLNFVPQGGDAVVSAIAIRPRK